MILKTKRADGTDKIYSAIRHSGNRAEYISEAHDDLHKDTLIVSSQSPKRQGNSLGVRRASVNFVRGVAAPVVADDKTELKDAKMEIAASFPVGMTDKEFEEFCANVQHFFSTPEQVREIFRIGKIH
nr:MAG: hypothetical protein 2 [Leviviridae sp.]